MIDPIPGPLPPPNTSRRMRNAVSSGTAKFGVEASNGALTITTTAKRKPEAVAKDGAENCLKRPFIEVLASFRKTWISGCPLCLQHALAQFVFADLRSKALFLSLNTNRDRNISGNPPAVFQGRK